MREEVEREDYVIMKEKITVLIVEPGKHPYTAEIPAGLESLQKTVGGLIEAVYPYEDEVALICCDEGKLLGLPLNRPLCDEDGAIYDIITGKFLVVGLTDDDFGSLSREMIEKYTEVFSWNIVK